MTNAAEPVRLLSELAARTGFGDFPAHTISRAKDLLLDTLGVGVAGSGLELAGALVRTAQGWGEGRESGVIGRRVRLPAPCAAIVNAFQYHGLEYDCLHEQAVLHPMACLLGAMLPFAEREGGIDGRSLLTAICLGVETATRLGMAATSGLRFFRPATAGGYGAALALAKLAGMDADGIANVLGLQHGQCSGTMQAHIEGSPLLGLQVGVNARASINAVDLARAGFDGPRDVLTGPFGYFRLFEERFDLETGFATLGRNWQIDAMSYKPFPSGRATHGMVDAIQSWRRTIDFDAEEVERVTGWLPPLTYRLVSRPPIANPAPSYARLCMGYVAAVALRRGTVDVADYAPAQLADADTLSLAKRIELHVDDNPDPNALSPQRFELRLKDGRRLELDLPFSLGHPARDLERPAVIAKFRRNWHYGASPLPDANADALIARIETLESCQDVAELINLTRNEES